MPSECNWVKLTFQSSPKSIWWWDISGTKPGHGDRSPVFFFSDSRAVVLNLDHILDSEKNYFFCCFIFGCGGSLLLCGLFSSRGEWGLLSSAGFWLRRLLLLQSTAPGQADFSGWGSWARVRAQQLWLTALVAPQHVGPSWIRNQTRVSWIDRWILYYRAPREALDSNWNLWITCHGGHSNGKEQNAVTHRTQMNLPDIMVTEKSTDRLIPLIWSSKASKTTQNGASCWGVGIG